MKATADTSYEHYFSSLIRGDQDTCENTVRRLLDREISVKALYTDIFQRSMYQVGDMWESGDLSVAEEHLATSLTLSLMPLVYEEVFDTDRRGLSAVVSCVVNEHHQMGGRMVADIFEQHGWDAEFLGAGITVETLLQTVEKVDPELLALSVGIYMNMPRLYDVLKTVRQSCPDLPIIVGGQAFRWGGDSIEDEFPGVRLLRTLDELERFIEEHPANTFRTRYDSP